MLKVRKGKATLAGAEEDETVDVNELVAVAEFGEPIYPGLKRLGSIERGGDKPAHVVIKGENYHALEALQFTHAGKVDCIYIDPPYNTGARDWKYNNDYVDGDDAYRHSKWLAFMKRRLALAERLLNPADSVLVVTIDEHEVHRLRLLLEQVFPSAYVQMVTIVVNPKGVAQGRFARVEEYALFCFLGEAGVVATPDDYLSDASTQRNTRFWKGLLRAGTNATPSDGLGMVYPIVIDQSSAQIVRVGATLRQRIDGGEAISDPNTWTPPAIETAKGETAVWPVRRDGQLGVWQAVPETLLDLNQQGMVKSVLRPEGWAISYVPNGIRKKIETGEVAIVARPPGGPVELTRVFDLSRAKTVWKRARHDAGWHGSVLLRKLLGERLFDFPKSVYAVRDALLPVLSNKPHAVVVDFFAGSGTTAHAVALMNTADGGSRQSILVTNNEVDHETAAKLRAQGIDSFHEQWDAAGIFERVTRPRLEAAMIGELATGQPVDLEYEGGRPAQDGFPESFEFVELEYLDSESVGLDRAFEAVAPLLWMRSGSRGPVLTASHDDAGRRKPYIMSDSYAVLFNPDRWRSFVEKLAPTVTHVFVVTDSTSEFANVSAEMPAGIEVVRLYENYLSTFAINTGASS
ncbi:MAG: DNA methyltransferase [Actinomycetota bacterium]